jgi:peptidoglycan-associated lipoprotein
MIILPNDTVFFPAGEDILTPEGTTLARLQADPIYIHNLTDLLIEGHCDPEEGTMEYCLALGERRANNVRIFLLNYLKKYFDYTKANIEVVSYGKERPMYLESNVKNQRTITIIR